MAKDLIIKCFYCPKNAKFIHIIPKKYEYIRLLCQDHVEYDLKVEDGKQRE